jgi:hypothetical protein
MRILGLLLAGSLSIVACNPFVIWGNATAQRDVAEKATARFHAMIDSAQYEAIWVEADPDLRGSGSAQDATAVFRMANRRFGQAQITVLSSWNVNFSTNRGSLVTLVYSTHFTRDSATETFRWRIHDGKAALLSYNINSPALLRAMLDEKD